MKPSNPFILIFMLLASQYVYSQAQRPFLTDTSMLNTDQWQRLEDEFGKNKKLPPGYEKIALYSLSFFPELKTNRIHFKLRDKGAPLSTRPSWGGIFRSAGKRRYMVFINAGGQEQWGSIFREASIPAQVGIIGHELSHIVNFARKNSFGLIGIGMAHLSKSYMDRFEFNTDSLAIAHGLGAYQLEWASIFDKLFSGTGMTDPFKNNNTPTGERYMSAATIRAYMDKMGYR